MHFGVALPDRDAVLAFKRLSIIDLEHSHQPLRYLDDRYTITFNGEIYNYPELRAELISGGRSNLTFLVSDDSSRWVLRRPPLHGLTPSAHDMAREYRVLSRLWNSFPPAPRAYMLCEDESVIGTMFYVMRHVDALGALPETVDAAEHAYDGRLVVDANFAWLAAEDPAYGGYALANMTGGNRLLIGVGWSMVVFVAVRQWRKRRATSYRGPTPAVTASTLRSVCCRGPTTTSPWPMPRPTPVDV